MARKKTSAAAKKGNAPAAVTGPSPSVTELSPSIPPPDPSGSTRIVYLPRQSSGIRVTEDTALTCAAVFACVRAISEDIASLPWRVRRSRPDGGSDLLANHPADWLLQMQANPETSAFAWREMSVSHVLCWGNAYSEIERDRIGRPVWLWQLAPDRVYPDRDSRGRLVYDIWNASGDNTVLDTEDVLHFKGLGFDGLVGYPVIRMAARSIGVSIAAEQFASDFWGNDATPGGVLESAGKLSDKALENVRETFEGRHRGPGKARRVAILEEGLKWAQTALPPEDAQFIMTRQHQVSEVARWFRMPAHKIGDLTRSTFCLPFAASVLTESGPCPAGEIRVGQRVWSLHNTNVLAALWGLSTVTRAECTGTDEILEIRTANHVLRCNARHRVLNRRLAVVGYDPNHHTTISEWVCEYIPAGDLAAGDVVAVVDGFPVIPAADAGFTLTPIISITRQPAEPVYDITVEDTHNFIADGIVVHNSNIESQEIEYVVDCLSAWCKRVESETNIKMFGRNQQGTTYSKLNLNARLRGDTAARSSFYQTLLDRGIFSINDVLELEDRNPIGSDGDKRFVQANMQLLERAGEPEEPAPPPEPDPPPEDPDAPDIPEDAPDGEPDEPAAEMSEATSRALQVIFLDVVRRAIRRESYRAAETAKRLAGNPAGQLAWLEEFAAEHHAYLRAALDVPFAALAEALGCGAAGREMASISLVLYLAEHMADLRRLASVAIESGRLGEEAAGWEASRAVLAADLLFRRARLALTLSRG